MATLHRPTCPPAPDRILVLAPHTDDAELGCGGTLARALDSGVEVFVAVFSTADESLPPGTPPGTLSQEFLRAISSIGINQDHTLVHHYPVRRFSYHRQDVLEDLIKLRRDLQPQLVLLPATTDLHQDHQVISAEGLRAFKDISVWGYELPWNHVAFTANAFVTLERRHLEKKWAALQAYKTQFTLQRPYFSWEFIYGLARVRGAQVKTEYAEAFEVVRIKIDLY